MSGSKLNFFKEKKEVTVQFFKARRILASFEVFLGVSRTDCSEDTQEGETGVKAEKKEGFSCSPFLLLKKPSL